MQDFEKLGLFYLGRKRDRDGKPGELLLYDSRDLVTHALCVGMTGSGKTGLCLGLMEEAAIDGIPAILIDPKGDLANLLLTFPELRPEDFRPWVSEDDARKRGISLEAHAEAEAKLWREGLAAWGQDGERVRRLRDAAEFAVYTPGSTAGLPVSILKSFAAPDEATVSDPEHLRERAGTTAASVLGLAGITADPLKSREHILLTTLLEDAWKKGEDLDLAALIGRIQSPPMARAGVMDMETFFPSKERFELAISLNNLLAAPTFQTWFEGEPLDVGRMLHTQGGKPRMAIFSIAHLNDSERMFFVALLLGATLSWMRGQPGTSSLRAILYMDEIQGYFPPVANPPPKTALLTLLKQARAYGLGVVLATQNPVDLDYKGLSNTGTWFIGRLQTERDKARLLEGLEGAAGAGGGGFDRGELERLMAGLEKRVFLVRNIHEDAPCLFETRWTLSYLRGPLTRAQIRVLAGKPRAEGAGAASGMPAPRSEPVLASGDIAPSPRPAMPRDGAARPVLPPEIVQYHLPARGGWELLYEPRVLGAASVRFVDRAKGVDAARDVVLLAEIGSGAAGVAWDSAAPLEIGLDELEETPEEGAEYSELPGAAAKPKSYAAWAKDLAESLRGSAELQLFRSSRLGLVSEAAEDERAFRIRLAQRAREERDRQVDALRKKYGPKKEALEERVRRAEQAVRRESEQAQGAGIQTAISIGSSILQALFGKKSLTQGNVGRAATAARGAGRTYQQAQDVTRAKENVEALQKEMEELEAELQAEVDAIGRASETQSEELETVSVKPRKTDVTVRTVALAWAPFRKDAAGRLAPAWE